MTITDEKQTENGTEIRDWCEVCRGAGFVIQGVRKVSAPRMYPVVATRVRIPCEWCNSTGERIERR